MKESQKVIIKYLLPALTLVILLVVSLQKYHQLQALRKKEKEEFQNIRPAIATSEKCFNTSFELNLHNYKTPFSIPKNCRFAYIKMWGAGGGVQKPENGKGIYGNGGGGGYVEFFLPNKNPEAYLWVEIGKVPGKPSYIYESDESGVYEISRLIAMAGGGGMGSFASQKFNIIRPPHGGGAGTKAAKVKSLKNKFCPSVTLSGGSPGHKGGGGSGGSKGKMFNITSKLMGAGHGKQQAGHGGAGYFGGGSGFYKKVSSGCELRSGGGGGLNYILTRYHGELVMNRRSFNGQDNMAGKYHDCMRFPEHRCLENSPGAGDGEIVGKSLAQPGKIIVAWGPKLLPPSSKIITFDEQLKDPVRTWYHNPLNIDDMFIRSVSTNNLNGTMFINRGNICTEVGEEEDVPTDCPNPFETGSLAIWTHKNGTSLTFMEPIISLEFEAALIGARKGETLFNIVSHKRVLRTVSVNNRRIKKIEITFKKPTQKVNFVFKKGPSSLISIDNLLYEFRIKEPAFKVGKSP